MSLLSADWWPLDKTGTYYRKFDVYPLKFPAILDHLTVAIANYGGPIAIANNQEESGGQKTQFTIQFYTAAGQNINRVPWRSSELLRMAWSESEDLICVQYDGRVFQYSMFGVLREDAGFTMGNEAQEMKLSDCQIFDSYAGTGIAVLTTAHRFYLVNNVLEPKVWRMQELPTPGRPQKPNCWVVYSTERNTKIVACIGSDIWVFTDGKQPEQMFTVFQVPVRHYADIAISPDRSKLAFISENGVLQIGSIDFKQTFCELDSGMRKKPERFMWCGNSAVIAYADQNLALIGYKGDKCPYMFDEPVYFGMEVDGLRIISSKTHEFLCEVPDVVQEIFKVGSVSPGALLLEAYHEYEKQCYKAHEYLKMLDTRIQEGVVQCIEAAGHEYNSELQKELLKAASFGKCFVPEIDPERYVIMTRLLRILNTVREYHIGVPLTFSQLERLTVPVLVDRLLARRQWPLAMKVCEYLRMEPEDGVNHVLIQWATYKLQQRSLSDDDVAKGICQQFAQAQGISYADVAKKADELKRRQVAVLLLDKEPQVSKQVSLLIKLGKNEKALARAIDSGDPDLIFFVILHLKDTLEKKGELAMILRKFPVAFALYKQYCRQESPSHLKAMLEQEDDHYGQAHLWVQEACQLSVFDVREKIDALRQAERCFLNAKDPDTGKLIEEQCRLVKYQEEFEEKFHQSFADLSLRETLMWLFENREQQKSDVLRKEFRVTDKQFWWWKIEALCRSGQWTELEQFSKTKKPPIGYLPFVEMCSKYAQIPEAKKYMSKLVGEEKVRALIKMKLLDEAADAAFEQKDAAALNNVMAHCGTQNRGLTERIGGLVQQLQNAKR